MAWALLAVLATAGPAWAGLGLSTKFGMVTLENLMPGTTVNTRELASLPYVITNRSDVPLEIGIEIMKPSNDQGMEKMGYDVIPDTSWVRVSLNDLQAGPGQDVATDVIITLPNDDKLLGKKYQVNLHATAKGPGMLGVGLMSVLRFTVASRRPTAAELAQKKKLDEIGQVAFDLSPTDVLLDGVEVGKSVDVAKAFKQTLKLSNPNDVQLVFELRSATAKEEEMGIVQGYEAAPDAGWLKVASGELKLQPDSIRKVGFTLALPDDPKLKGRKFQFLVVATVAGGAVELRRVARILVTTK